MNLLSTFTLWADAGCENWIMLCQKCEKLQINILKALNSDTTGCFIKEGNQNIYMNNKVLCGMPDSYNGQDEVHREKQSEHRITQYRCWFIYSMHIWEELVGRWSVWSKYWIIQEIKVNIRKVAVIMISTVYLLVGAWPSLQESLRFNKKWKS